MSVISWTAEEVGERPLCRPQLYSAASTLQVIFIYLSIHKLSSSKRALSARLNYKRGRVDTRVPLRKSLVQKDKVWKKYKLTIWHILGSLLLWFHLFFSCWFVLRGCVTLDFITEWRIATIIRLDRLDLLSKTKIVQIIFNLWNVSKIIFE